ncbi:toll/interleukin-1 receptor domain-containing protein [Actinokineospora diospyrosa]|uniref:SEFIR domain-containing protein n=1 Tax=Actinokineospora diospyrosa TaxID=103728 RepID=A0ABT1IBD6_9PSEU|nr:toll/interleukin-1 receptor domain-containing protein [Actinokineospora diospyrosa]MCP2269940.1 SEFIR domain-containing protein [Actinokineospora diospyrosa]
MTTDSTGVDLVLVNAATRHVSTAPAAVEIGAVRLGGWQVHPVAPTRFPGRAAHVVKINFDLWLAPDVPVPPWLEVGFDFGADAVVVDAVPRASSSPGPGRTYAVDQHLSLVEANTGVHLPEVSSTVQVFGIGGREIRWRHRDPRPGSHAAWIVLLTPQDATHVPVTASARYDLPPEETFGYAPATRPHTFDLDLAPGIPVAQVEAPALAAPTVSPRVFVSYAHEDHEHISKVVALAEFLVSRGLDVHMDRWDLEVSRDWYLWAIGQIKAADFILVVASPACKAAGEGEVSDEVNRGLQSEMGLLREALHARRSVNRTRILPVVLPGRSIEEIPVFLQPHTVDHFIISDFTVAGTEDLLRILTAQPPYVRPLPPIGDA